MVDRSGAEPVRIFESGAILTYLAEKFSLFLPETQPERAETLSWLFWQMGSAPFVGGGFGHFYAYAPEKYEYPINRYAMETKRQLDVLNRQLSQHEFIAGDNYTIADMAAWPWYGGLVLGTLYNAATFLSVSEYPHVIRWAKQIAARPAVQRGRGLTAAAESRQTGLSANVIMRQIWTDISRVPGRAFSAGKRICIINAVPVI